MTQSTNIDDVWIFGINDDTRDAFCILESHMPPGFSAIRGLVDSVPKGDTVANVCLPSSGIDHIGIAWLEGQVSYGGHRLLVKNWLPGYTAVRCFPDST